MNNLNLYGFFKYVIALCMAVLLVSCTIKEDADAIDGGGDGIGAIKDGYTRVSGVVAVTGGEPVVGVKVSLKTPSEAELASGVTNQVGRFTLDVVKQEIEDGYKLVVVEDDSEASGLSAIYAPDHTLNANLTPITTLVTALAGQQEDTTALKRRDTAVKLLVDIGLVSRVSWFQLPSIVSNASASQTENTTQSEDLVDWEKLGGVIASSGLDAWVEQVVSEVSSDQGLSPGSMLVFPQAQGGIIKVYLVKGEQLPLMQGAMYKEQVKVQQVTGNEQYAYELIESVPGMTLTSEGMLQYTPPMGSEAGKVSLHITVKNTKTDKGLDFKTELEVVTTEVIAEGIIGVEGGYIGDAGMTTMASLPPNAVSGPSSLRILRAYGENNKPRYAVASSLTTMLPGKLLIPMDDIVEEQIDVSADIEIKLGEDVVLEVKEDVVLEEDESDFKKYGVRDFKWEARRTWYSRYATLMDGDVARTNRLTRGSLCPVLSDASEPLVQCGWEATAVVESFCPFNPTFTPCKRKTPILLINGYNMTDIDSDLPGFGGDYWGPELREQLFLAGYAVYEFRWQTNTSIESMLPHLTEAVTNIVVETDRKVTLVGNSIGGLLARAYLEKSKDTGDIIFQEGLNKEDIIIDYVNSLITIGAPHSGILSQAGTYGGIDFPKSQDNNRFEACRQISCHELGNFMPSTYTVKINEEEIALFDLFGVDPEPMGFLVSLQDNVNQLPEKVNVLNIIQVPEADSSGRIANELSEVSQYFKPKEQIESPVANLVIVDPYYNEDCYQQPTTYLKKDTLHGSRICEKLSKLMPEKPIFDLPILEHWLEDSGLLNNPGKRKPNSIQMDVSVLSAKTGWPLSTVDMKMILDTPKGLSWSITQIARLDAGDLVGFGSVQLSDARYYLTLDHPRFQKERFDRYIFSPDIYHGKHYVSPDIFQPDKHYQMGFGPIYLTPIGMTETADKAIVIHSKNSENGITGSYKIIKKGIQIRQGEVEAFNQQFLVEDLIPGEYLLILEENDKHPRQTLPFPVILDQPTVFHVVRANKNETTASVSWQHDVIDIAFVVAERGEGFGLSEQVDTYDPDAVIANYALETEKVSTHLGGVFADHAPELLLDSVVLKSPYDLAGGGIYEFVVGTFEDMPIYWRDGVNHIMASFTTKDGRSRNIHMPYIKTQYRYKYWNPFSVENGEVIICSSGCWYRYVNYHEILSPEGR